MLSPGYIPKKNRGERRDGKSVAKKVRIRQKTPPDGLVQSRGDFVISEPEWYPSINQSIHPSISYAACMLMLTPAPTPRLGRRAESVNRTDAVRRVTGLLYFFLFFSFLFRFLVRLCPGRSSDHACAALLDCGQLLAAVAVVAAEVRDGAEAVQPLALAVGGLFLGGRGHLGDVVR